MDYNEDKKWDEFMRKAMNSPVPANDGQYIKPKKSKEEIIGSIRMTLNRDQIMTFVSGLHETQWALIEATVASREAQGFPEATAVIKHIMELK